MNRRSIERFGIYAICQFIEGKPVGDAGRGKFITAAVREKDGKRRLQGGGYNDLKPPRKQ